jgi:hypothetical protein
MNARYQLITLMLFWATCCNGFGVRWRRRHRHGNSPLDDGNFLFIVQKFFEFTDYDEHGPNAIGQFGPEILIPDRIAMDKLPECQKACNTAFSNAVKVAMQAPNHHERFIGVCM